MSRVVRVNAQRPTSTSPTRHTFDQQHHSTRRLQLADHVLHRRRPDDLRAFSLVVQEVRNLVTSEELLIADEAADTGKKVASNFVTSRRQTIFFHIPKQLRAAITLISKRTHLVDSAIEGAHHKSLRVHVEDEILTHHRQPNQGDIGFPETPASITVMC